MGHEILLNKKIVLALIGLVTVLIGGGSLIAIDLSQTNIGQVGDINTIIQNQYGVDLDEFRVMCDEGLIPEEFQNLCRLVP